MAEQDFMSPDASPSTEGQRTGVRRVNNLPIIIAVSAVLIFMLIVVKVAAGRSEQVVEKAAEGAEGKGGNSTMLANEIVGSRTSGVIDAVSDAPTMPADGTLLPVTPSTGEASGGSRGVPIAPVTDLNQPPMPPRGGDDQPLDLADEQLKQRKMDLFAQAVAGSTKIDLPDMSSLAASSSAGGSSMTPRSSSEVQARLAQVRREIAQQRSTDPGTAYQAQLRQVQAQINGGGMGGSGSLSGGDAEEASDGNNRQQGYDTFDANGKTDRWSLNASVEAPTTPYEVSAGDVIPGLMISGLKTARQGQIIAQVSRDVYDSQSGCHLLIPNGTRMVGTYSNDMGFGEETVLVAWQRLRFPDGSKLDIGAMPGTDMAGYAGFQDMVDHHLTRVFGSALLMSAFTAGASMATNQGNNNSGSYERPTVSSELSAALGQQIGQTSAQIITKNLNVAPTATIRPGYRFNIMVVKDLKFVKPYKTYGHCSSVRN